METIRTVDELQHQLTMGPGYGGYAELMEAVELDSQALMAHSLFAPEEYQRIRLYDTSVVEAVLTCWEPGQQGQIHNFNHSVGWFKVLKGESLLEHFVISPDKAQPKKKGDLSEVYTAPQMGYISDDMGYHRFSNPSSERAWVLVLYSGRIEQWQVYDADQGRVSTVRPQVHKNFDSGSE